MQVESRLAQSIGCLSAAAQPRRSQVRIKRTAMVALGIMLLAPAAWAQYTESVLYSFCSASGCTDGQSPTAGLIFDSLGNLYGTANNAVFELSPPVGGSGPWTETVLFSGTSLLGGLILDSSGDLYGTTANGGANGGGAVFELTPPSGGSGTWTETVLYSFCTASGCADGEYPEATLVFDSQGNLYGTTFDGGADGPGTVFELSPPSAGSGPWTETVLYSFTSGSDGGKPIAGVIIDSQGNLYGTTTTGGNLADCGGSGCGVVFELSPPTGGSGPWPESVLYSFTNGSDGGDPRAGLIFDSKGNLYGTAKGGGAYSVGTAFELTPPSGGSGPWTESVLYNFCPSSGCADGEMPYAGLLFDSKGNLYGTTYSGGTGSGGTAFELSPPGGGTGPWTETVLYNFCSASGCADGQYPEAGMVFDSHGNLFGTTNSGGAKASYGTVFELASPIATTTTMLTSSTNPSAYGQAVTFTATVSGSSPTGTVSFAANATTISGCAAITLTSNQAQCTTAALPVGSDAIVATYSGDSSNTGSSGTLTQVVNLATTVTTVASSVNPSTIGQSVTFTASVTGGGSPTGTVGFTANGVAITGCSGLMLASGIAQCATSALSVGSDAIVATYSGDTNNTGSSGVLTQIVNQATTTTTVASSINPSTSGQSVTFTATVIGGFSSTGTVSFATNTETISGCSAVTLASGQAQCTSSILPVGSDSIVATYSGDTNNTGSSGTLMQVVNKTSTTTGLVSSQNPSTVGQSVTFTAAVSDGSSPTGTVRFTASGAAISGCSAVALASSQAQCTTSSLPAGSDSIAATYSGDSNNAGSSGTLTQVVNHATSTTTVTSSANPSTSGESVTFTATVAPAGPPTPTGTVGFTSNGTAISGCSAVTLSASRTATCTTSVLPVGTESIKAAYSGDSDYSSSSDALAQVVNRAASATTLTSSANPSTVGESVTFTATVAPAGPPMPTGMLSFTANGITITGCAAATLSSSLTATCVTAALPVGTESIIATYSGDSNYLGSTSSSVSQVVDKIVTSTALVSATNPSTSGQSVVLTATVSGGMSPTGTIGFTANGAAISGCGSVALASSRAQCTTSSLPVGDDTIMAVYSGDSNNAGSSGVLIQAVNSTTRTATTMTLASSQNPSTYGQLVTLTATVSPAGPPAPTGTVAFASNGTAISGCSGEAVSSAHTATCSTSALAVGTGTIAATYSGDPYYLPGNGTFTQFVNPVASAVQFIPITPCRVVDTRGADGPYGGPELTAGETRSFAIPSGPCAGIPETATAYSVNVTVVPPGPLGYLTIWPTGEGQPVVSTLNSLDGRIKANAAIIPAGTDGAVSVYVNNATNVLLDISGYFAASNSVSLEFYPLTPCRVADTRKADGPLGGPALVAATERNFPVLSSSCGIPSTAQAYSLNFTVVPPAIG
ncbi:MAG: Ig-like domain-containing protein, partial [Terriglobales bacterium]